MKPSLIIFDFKILLIVSCLLIIYSCSNNNKNEIGKIIKPERNRFTKVILAKDLDEPMQFEITHDGRVLFVERKGRIKYYDTKTGQTTIVGEIPVSVGYYDKNGKENSPSGEDGMQGVVLDPEFQKNGHIYLYYSPKGGAHRSILTRYTLQGDTLVHDSKKLLLTVNNQRESCCHLGGGMVFDANGNLLLSTGDNTPNDSRGYTPLDDRPGRERFDSQRTSSNSNSLRGKILRIHPEADGTYSIPEGNLFPEGTPKTRPEIYTMGNRNPWRLSIDSKSGFLYWGEVGPVGIVDSIGIGPRSYDEFNVARKASNFGWPYFIADNKPYWRYDYETQKSGKKYNPHGPLNKSRNNTGLEQLPPVEPAMIWYPQSEAVDFPLMGSGSNSAVGGPIYRKINFKNASRPFPDYYEGKWFITDWTRGWIMAVTLDNNGGYKAMEEFFPGINLNGAIDMDFGPDGDLYVLEYGRGPFQRNQGAQLIRIEYAHGNRKPKAVASSPRIAGAVPFTVLLSSEGTIDYDNDELSYIWEVSNKGELLYTYNTANHKVTLEEPGEYKVKLSVVDPAGLKSESSFVLFAGNEPPKIKFDLGLNNKTFFFPDVSISYNLIVTDKEDGMLLDKSIAAKDVALQIDYLEDDFNIEKISKIIKQNPASEPLINILATELIGNTDCRSCHAINKTLIGPSYKEISNRYYGKKDAKNYLKSIIAEGGQGQWEAELAMPAHPSLSEDDIKILVEYILSLNGSNQNKTLPPKGDFTYSIAKMTNSDVDNIDFKKRLSDKFLFRASYTDKGNQEAPKQSTTELLVLRNPVVPVIFFDEFSDVIINHSIRPQFSSVIAKKSGSAIILKNIDFTGIKEIMLEFKNSGTPLYLDGWKIEARLNDKTGVKIGEIDDASIYADNERPLNHITSFSLKPSEGLHDLFIVFVNDDPKAKKMDEVQLMTVTFVLE